MADDEKEFRALSNRLGEALKARDAAWYPVLAKQRAIGLGESTQNPTRDEEVRLEKAREAVAEAEKAIEDFMTARGYRR